MLGTIGFGSLTITKLPDASSADLFQLAADNDGIYDGMEPCPPVVMVVLEIPLDALNNGSDTLWVATVPSIITEWHVSLPRSNLSSDTRERISFMYGGITYSYGVGFEPIAIEIVEVNITITSTGQTGTHAIYSNFSETALPAPNLNGAACNLDVFCNLYPCVCSIGTARTAPTNAGWFDLLNCSGGVDIFNPVYDPPPLLDFFINDTVDGIQTLEDNYLQDNWK